MVRFNKEITLDNQVVLKDMTEYSSYEQKIGIWTDGHPLYRKVCYCDAPVATTSGAVSYKDFDLNVEANVIMIDTAYVNNNGVRYPIPYTTDENKIIKAFLLNKKTIRIGNSNSDFNNKTCLFIIHYTKTTD